MIPPGECLSSRGDNIIVRDPVAKGARSRGGDRSCGGSVLGSLGRSARGTPNGVVGSPFAVPQTVAFHPICSL